jgi:Fe-S cluster biogenesis protein NfuA
MAQEPYDELVEAPGTPDLRLTGEHIDALIEQIAGGGPANPLRARERAEELVRVVTDLYGAGLERLLELVHESGHLDEPLLEALADDDLVASLLLVHGLHPYDVRTRVEQALDHVRPYLGSHGGDVELLGVEGGVARVRFGGTCNGCASSTVTLTNAIEEAIARAAPELERVEAEGVADAQPQLVQIGSLTCPTELSAG